MKKSFVSTLLPFDGTCAASEGSDVVLLFDDKTVLKTHRFLLSRASPVFRDIVDCRESDEIHLGQTEGLPWRIILNVILALVPIRDSDLLKDSTLVRDSIEDATVKVLVCRTLLCAKRTSMMSRVC